jgi:predicted DNA-binding transcriptional regulator
MEDFSLNIFQNNVKKKEIVVYDSLIEEEARLPFRFMNLDFSCRTKFTKLVKLLEIPLLNREHILISFCRIQRLVNVVSRLKWIWRWKRAITYNTDDLYMNPIDENKKYIVTLLQNNTKYIFHLRELLSIIQTSLSHCYHFFPDPAESKNPYTNLAFNKSALYNIYFALRWSYYTIPPLFEAFFQSNFNYYHFSVNNEDLINSEYLKTYAENHCVEDLYYEVKEMFESFNIRCSIHKKFPSEKLMSIMKPYLHLYYIAQYSFNYHKRSRAKRYLLCKLREFYKFNRIFGRRKVIFVKKGTYRKCEYVFDDRHISFYTSSMRENFMNTHLAGEYTYRNERHTINASPHIMVPVALENEDTESYEDSDTDSNNDSDDAPVIVRNNNRISTPVLEESDEEEEEEEEEQDEQRELEYHFIVTIEQEYNESHDERQEDEEN